MMTPHATLGVARGWAVLSALAVDTPPRPFEIVFVFTLASAASAFELSEFAPVVCDIVTGVNIGSPLTVPGGICVCAVPLTLPAAVLKKIRLSSRGYCQYLGATSITTKY